MIAAIVSLLGYGLGAPLVAAASTLVFSGSNSLGPALTLVALLLGIGLYFSRRQRSVTDFWLAGRELGPVIIGFSSASAWITTWRSKRTN